MSDTPLKDSIANIGKAGEGFTLETGVDLEAKEKRVGLEYFDDIGKPGGWSLGAAAEWFGGKAGRIVGRINWKPGGDRGQREAGTKPTPNVE